MASFAKSFEELMQVLERQGRFPPARSLLSGPSADNPSADNPTADKETTMSTTAMPDVSTGEPTANPLADGLTRERRAPPGVLIVFGASGDLTSRKLMPAIARLVRRRLLPPAFSVVGVARTQMDDDGSGA